MLFDDAEHDKITLQRARVRVRVRRPVGRRQIYSRRCSGVDTWIAYYLLYIDSVTEVVFLTQACARERG